jgi:NAD-dependent SIR2 family protein deacetylase
MRPSSGPAPKEASVEALLEFIRQHDQIMVLTGAGVSTASGIPAYRDNDGQWRRRNPILFHEFMASEVMRRRYWARSYFGWPQIAKARPNAAHRALARLEEQGSLSGLVTQNVDGLHARAGSKALIEFHGSLAKVTCLDCGERFERDRIQRELETLNPDWSPTVLGFNPDGDAELDAKAYPGFRVADCSSCGGRLKPDVVFFGEPVPAERAASVNNTLNRSDALIVVGSSLVVMSGLRIVRQAASAGKPVVAVNVGRTRGDDLLRFKLSQDCVEVFERVISAIDRQPAI